MQARKLPAGVRAMVEVQMQRYEEEMAALRRENQDLRISKLALITSTAHEIDFRTAGDG